jgi:hypothetical protein
MLPLPMSSWQWAFRFVRTQIRNEVSGGCSSVKSTPSVKTYQLRREERCRIKGKGYALMAMLRKPQEV